MYGLQRHVVEEVAHASLQPRAALALVQDRAASEVAVVAPGRFLPLDALRGLCAVAVCLFHARYNSPILASPLVQNAWMFVDFFFVLSGFVIAANYRDRIGATIKPANFLGLRLGRIYPLHLALLGAFLIVELLGLFYWKSGGNLARVPFDESHSLSSLATNLLLIQSAGIHDTLTWNKPAWTIATEFWSYVAFALLVASAGARLEAWMAAVAVAAPLLLLAVSPHGLEATYDWGIVRSFYGFSVGVIAWAAWRRWASRVQPSLLLATLAEFAMLAAILLFVAKVHDRTLDMLAPWLFGAAVLVFARGGGMLSRLLSGSAWVLVGTLSYSIYMVHAFVQGRLATLALGVEHWTGFDLVVSQPTAAGIRPFIGADPLTGTAALLLMLATVFCVSLLTYRFIELPGQRWSRRRFGGAAGPKGILVRGYSTARD